MFERQEAINVPVLTIERRQHRRDPASRSSRAAARSVEAKQPVGDMGFTAYINDSEGNLIGLWENASG